ncbi:Ppx/GppA phosphatase family protein [Rhizobium sp. C4]|uniref:Ppx/GppA phosphatase family protein n=1 Tax=Rhizobium sp. C4 TaxID=1349800 RepID=UPI001E429CE9|nr:Ppx/GppA phosphatase family protein [Rhizobium sp. C4]MCD2172767.1 Ppx/GppA family phosphatase [Rhizobium sp. C4]
MEDPSNGSQPSLDGAFDRTGSPGKSTSRRGRRRRSGKSRASAAPSAKGQPPVKAGENERPDQQPGPDGRPGNDASRKRKRRRKKGGQPQQQQQATKAQPQSPDNRAPGSKKKQLRNRRSLQGRPLAAPSDRPASSVARPQPAHDARPQAERATAPPSDLYAALDLGTNNCRLLIAQPTRPGQFRVVDAFSRIVRLGEGLGSSGRLSEDAMERSIEALKICAAKLSTRNIRKRRLIATEACRAAENGEEFLARVTAETGLELEIINRETEARLAVSGCSSLVGRETRSVVLFDIGGGSSEIAVIKTGESRSARLANHITHWTSLPVGVVTLSERHGGRDVTPAVFDAMVREVEGMLAAFESPDVSELADDPDSGFHLIGTSGTVTTLAGVHLGLPKYDRRKVDGVWLSDAEVSAMQAKLLSWDFAGRAANPCIGPDRADLVLAGCAILEAIRRRWPSPRMRVADRGLREGLLTDMMADDGVWRRLRHRGGTTSWRSRPGDKT